MCDQCDAGLTKRQGLKESKGPVKWQGFFYVYSARIYYETKHISEGVRFTLLNKIGSVVKMLLYYAVNS
jgi:hypothetical protein